MPLWHAFKKKTSNITLPPTIMVQWKNDRILQRKKSLGGIHGEGREITKELWAELGELQLHNSPETRISCTQYCLFGELLSGKNQWVLGISVPASKTHRHTELFHSGISQQDWSGIQQHRVVHSLVHMVLHTVVHRLVHMVLHRVLHMVVHRVLDMVVHMAVHMVAPRSRHGHST